MVVVKLLLVALALELSLVATEVAARCRPCTLDTVGCAPKGGILIFNAWPGHIPAYWLLRASRHRPLGRLDGRLEVRSDVADPGVPGFPGELRDGFYFGEPGRFRGSVRENRLQGVASYPDGSRCHFAVTIAFGLGGAELNAFVCNDPAGDLVAWGGVDLQGIRLRGCRRPSGQP